MPDPITLALLATAGIGGVSTWRAVAEEQTREAPDGPDGTRGDDVGGDVIAYTGGVELWRALVLELALGASQPPEFHMAWIARESGGNPASVGSRASGPDGYAREMGLYQLYNPDELKIAGFTSAQLRAACSARSGTQTLVRPLTDEEMRWHVQAGVNYIARRKRDTDTVLAAVGADWSATDTWRMVKLFHALTGLPRAAALAARDQLGRAPSGWDELRDAATSLDLTRYGGSGLVRYAPYGDYSAKRGPLPNAEAVGGVVQS